MTAPEISLRGIPGLGEVRAGMHLGRLLAEQAQSAGMPLQAGDILVVTQKVVSKAEGRIRRLSEVRPSPEALEWAEQAGRDPRLVELIRGETRRVIRRERELLIMETRQGYICANAGVDTSNVDPGCASLLPVDPDRSAAIIREEVLQTAGVSVAVIISDTFGRPWREGQVNVALGVAGMGPVRDYRGQRDSHGNPLRTTQIAVADQLASAAELVMGKSMGIPAAVIRGYEFPGGEGRGRDLLRAAREDLFR